MYQERARKAKLKGINACYFDDKIKFFESFITKVFEAVFCFFKNLLSKLSTNKDWLLGRHKLASVPLSLTFLESVGQKDTKKSSAH